MIFVRTLRLLPYFMCANSEGSGETARMRRLAWAFAGRLCDKYHNLMSWLKCFNRLFRNSYWKHDLSLLRHWRLLLYIYILGVFTEKPYSKPLERNVVYIPIITMSHATSHDFKWRQNKPWMSTIWLDVIDAVPLLAEKMRVNVFLLQF